MCFVWGSLHLARGNEKVCFVGVYLGALETHVKESEEQYAERDLCLSFYREYGATKKKTKKKNRPITDLEETGC